MKSRLIPTTVMVALLAGMVLAQGHRDQRLNPMIDLMEQGKRCSACTCPVTGREKRRR